jgi:hypothetical protein
VLSVFTKESMKGVLTTEITETTEQWKIEASSW